MPGKNELVLKAQVLAGGRGKGRFDNGLQGGVHMISRYVFAAQVISFLVCIEWPHQSGASTRICIQDDRFEAHH